MFCATSYDSPAAGGTSGCEGSTWVYNNSLDESADILLILGAAGLRMEAASLSRGMKLDCCGISNDE